jgi:hypothetical protein
MEVVGRTAAAEFVGDPAKRASRKKAAIFAVG